MFIKTTFEDSKELKDIELCIKRQSVPVFPDIIKIADFR